MQRFDGITMIKESLLPPKPFTRTSTVCALDTMPGKNSIHLFCNNNSIDQPSPWALKDEGKGSNAQVYRVHEDVDERDGAHEDEARVPGPLDVDVRRAERAAGLGEEAVVGGDVEHLPGFPGHP
jgi:hypothetical protein